MEHREIGCDQLIDEIYDAGARPDRWAAALSSIASAAGAEGAIMFGFCKSRGLLFEYNGSLDDTSSKIFKARHLNNAWVEGMARLPSNQLVLSDSIVKVQQLKRSAFFDEVLRPQQLGYGALSTLKFEDIEIQFSVQKLLSRGPFRSTEIITLRRILPHVRRAIGVSLRLERGATPPIGTGSLVHQLGCPGFIVNGRGELLDANTSAHRLATGGGAFSLQEHSVKFANPSEHRRMLQGVKRVMEGAPLQSMLLIHGADRFEVVAIALKGQEMGRVLHLSCTTAAVLLLVKELSMPRGEEFRIVRGLTAAEWRVAKIAAGGVSNIYIARTLNLSLNTVKTHLRRVYLKLNIRRQGELIMCLSSASVEEGSRDP